MNMTYKDRPRDTFAISALDIAEIKTLLLLKEVDADRLQRASAGKRSSEARRPGPADYKEFSSLPPFSVSRAVNSNAAGTYICGLLFAANPSELMDSASQ